MRSLAVLLLALPGCGIAEPDFLAFATGSVYQSTSGTVTSNGGLTAVAVWTSDSPVDGADNVWITFERVSLVRDGRETVLSNQRRTLDMLALQHGIRRQLAEGDVPPGTYDTVRIELATSGGLTHWVVANGEAHELVLAPGARPVLEFPAEYRLRPDEELELQVDFNVRLSIYEAGGVWYLDPTGFMHDPLNAGAIDGTALPAGSVISAQREGEEFASAKSGPDGYFKLTPIEAGTYDLVVTRSGSAPAFRPRVRVAPKVTTGGQHFLLAPAPPGSIQGDYLAVYSPGLTIRLVWNGSFIGFAGVDPYTGRFAFPAVPPGILEVEAWDSVGPLGKRQNILVESDFESLLQFR